MTRGRSAAGLRAERGDVPSSRFEMAGARSARRRALLPTAAVVSGSRYDAPGQFAESGSNEPRFGSNASGQISILARFFRRQTVGNFRALARP